MIKRKEKLFEFKPKGGLIKAKKLNKKWEMRKHRFRVAIFGSARIQPNDKNFRQVFHLAQAIGKEGYDVITGGGPGIMMAANEGHVIGDPNGKAESIGLLIKLPWENSANPGVEVMQIFDRFAQRLETFLGLMSVAVICTGGLGTVLELSYMWQYTQVKKERPFPIILVGESWGRLIEWFKKDLLKTGMMSPEDFDNIFVVRNNEEAMKLINQAYRIFTKTKGSNKPILPKLKTEFKKKAVRKVKVKKV